MIRYGITKHLKVDYELAAEDAQSALAADPTPDAVYTVIRQRAKDLDRPAGAAGTITDREMRPGRRFERRYKGAAFTATVTDDGGIRLEGDKIGAPTTCKNLHVAAQIAIELTDGRKHAANAFQYWHEAAEPREPADATPAEEPTEPAAKPKGKRVSKKS